MENQSKYIMIERNKFAALVKAHRKCLQMLSILTYAHTVKEVRLTFTLEEICDSLSNTIPWNGTLFTADGAFLDQLRTNGRRKNCRVELAQPDSGLPDFDFPENVALALAVCREIGVDRDRALEGILRYQPDPYALSLFRLPSGAAFVNAMSVNDPQSTQLDYHRVAGRPGMVGRRLVLLINNRPDRGYRTEHMMMVARGWSQRRSG